MGNLTNLYISKSYQSLIHLGSDNTASTTLVGLQDGLGNSIGISVNTSGSLSISGSFTASLQQGYVWVGDNNNKTTLVPTSSFAGGVPVGTATTGSNAFFGNQSISGSLVVSGSEIITGTLTASLQQGYAWVGGVGNISKLVATSSFGGGSINTGSFATTGSNVFIGNQTISGSGDHIGLNIISGSSEWFFGTRNVSAPGRLVISSSNQDRWIELDNNSGYLEVYAQTTNFNNAVNMRGRLQIRNTFIESNNQLKFPTGSDQQTGIATLNGSNPGTVTVSNSLVSANSIIMLTKQTNNNPNAGPVVISAKSAGSFTITSNHNGDTDVVGWFIINDSQL
jgi:hypothetical protein